MDKLTAYRVFCSVLEQGSFAAAARVLGVSNAAVSKNVRELEESVGVQLIMRTTRKLSVTEAGDLYYHRVREILEIIAKADEAVSELAGDPQGTLKVTAPISLGLIMITPAIAAFRQAYPLINVSLELTDDKVDLLERGLDLAIRGGAELPDSSLKVRKLRRLKRVVCASPQYLESRPSIDKPSDLKDHDCILYSRWERRGQWSFSREGISQTVHVKGGYCVNNSMAIRQAVLNAGGVSLFPEIMVAADLSAGTLVRLLPQWKTEEQAIYALYPDSTYMIKRVRVFIDFLVKRLRADS